MSGAPKFTPGPWVYDTTRPFNAYSDDATGSIVATTDGFQYAPRPEVEKAANARLIAAAPDLYAGGAAQTALLRQAQVILTQYLIPDGIDGPEAINQLLGLLDGPDQRSAQATWDAALAKARGQA